MTIALVAYEKQTLVDYGVVYWTVDSARFGLSSLIKFMVLLLERHLRSADI